MLATDRSLCVGTVCWVSQCVRLQCLWVLLSLAADQSNSAWECTLGWSLHLKLCTPAVGATASH